MSSLHGLAPKAKAWRFRALLPVIEAKIEAGVCHADIMRALKERGSRSSETPTSPISGAIAESSRPRSGEGCKQSRSRPDFLETEAANKRVCSSYGRWPTQISRVE